MKTKSLDLVFRALLNGVFLIGQHAIKHFESVDMGIKNDQIRLCR